MSQVKISRQRGTVKRVPRGGAPVIEIDLNEDQQIVSFEAHSQFLFSSDRTTEDWSWTAWVATKT